MSEYGGCILNPNGTLFDLRMGYSESFGPVFGMFGMAFDESKVMYYADMSAEDLFAELNTGCTCRFRDFMIAAAAGLERNLVPSASVFDDAAGFLDSLDAAGVPAGLFANLYGDQISDLLSTFSMEGRFQSVVGIERVMVPRPDPVSIVSCARDLGSDPTEMAMISCSPKDIETGRNAGMRTVLVDRDGTGLDCGQDSTVRSLSEAAELLL